MLWAHFIRSSVTFHDLYKLNNEISFYGSVSCSHFALTLPCDFHEFRDLPCVMSNFSGKCKSYATSTHRSNYMRRQAHAT